MMKLPRTRWWGPWTVPASAVLAIVAGAGWLGRQTLHIWASTNPAAVPAALAGLPVLMGVMGGALWLEHSVMGRAWTRRTATRLGLPNLIERPAWLRWLSRRPDPLEWLCRPLFRTGWGRGHAERWRAAGLDAHPSRFILLMILSAMAGWLVGARIAGIVLATALAASAPLVPVKWVNARAEARRRLFDDQIPVSLDALASGLAAGLSLQQAVSFSASELPPPVSHVLARMDIRLRLGLPVEQALDALLESHAGEMMALAVEGIKLQRQYGGDLVRMLGETAELLRMRLELEKEVRVVTSQGRLSGAVVAGLVPVSAGLLLIANPSYIDVLFETLPGQILLVVALLLQLTGWAILGRLVRVRY